MSSAARPPAWLSPTPLCRLGPLPRRAGPAGVVMGLDRGGTCRGFAYRVAAEAVAGVVGYLDARELIYPVYRRRRLPVTVFDDSGARRRVTALTYVVDRTDPLYLGDRDLACLAACVATARASPAAAWPICGRCCIISTKWVSATAAWRPC